MTEHITVVGILAKDPQHVVTATGLEITNLRLAATQRKFDREQGRWVDDSTNWYNVAVFRRLAKHAQHSFHKGDPIIVTGKLRVREWRDGEKFGRDVEIEAEALGHSLQFGTSVFTRAHAAPIRSTPPGDHSGEPSVSWSSERPAALADLEPEEAPLPF
ncbi:single-stranded DNA-binding protein [Humidisolicoccus flavus]|uniref:single-stranded DNA-binding protein n=1 Tax=Humidisolicoccus flavus TaxID=3111414 RepID=UPI00324A485B